MSRSRKRTPIVKDFNPGMKRIANRRVRRKLAEIGEPYCYPAQYRRMTEKWDICDFSFYVDKNSKYVRK